MAQDPDLQLALAKNSRYANTGNTMGSKILNFLLDTVGGAYQAHEANPYSKSTLIPGIVNGVQGLRIGNYYNKLAQDKAAMSQMLGNIGFQQTGRAEFMGAEPGKYQFPGTPEELEKVVAGYGNPDANKGFNAANAGQKPVFGPQAPAGIIGPYTTAYGTRQNKKLTDIATNDAIQGAAGLGYDRQFGQSGQQPRSIGQSVMQGWHAPMSVEPPQDSTPTFSLGASAQGLPPVNPLAQLNPDSYGVPDPTTMVNAMGHGIAAGTADQTYGHNMGTLAETQRHNQGTEKQAQDLLRAELHPPPHSRFYKYAPNPPQGPQPNSIAALKELLRLGPSHGGITLEQYKNAILKNATDPLGFLNNNTPGPSPAAPSPAAPPMSFKEWSKGHGR